MVLPWSPNSTAYFSLPAAIFPFPRLEQNDPNFPSRISAFLVNNHFFKMVHFLACEFYLLHYNCVCDWKTKNTNQQPVLFPVDYSYRLVSKSFVEHKTCKCDCIVKPTDCYPKQTYSGVHCQCECKRDSQTCPSGKQASPSIMTVI